MAGLCWSTTCPQYTPADTSTHTWIVLAAPTNQRVKIKEWSASFIGTSNTAQPVKVQIYEIASGGSTGTGTSLTFNKDNQSDAESVLTTGNCQLTAEPTGTKLILQEENIHPQTGFCWQAPFAGEMFIKGTTWWGLQGTEPATVGVSARVRAEE